MLRSGHYVLRQDADREGGRERQRERGGGLMILDAVGCLCWQRPLSCTLRPCLCSCACWLVSQIPWLWYGALPGDIIRVSLIAHCTDDVFCVLLNRMFACVCVNDCQSVLMVMKIITADDWPVVMQSKCIHSCARTLANIVDCRSVCVCLAVCLADCLSCARVVLIRDVLVHQQQRPHHHLLRRRSHFRHVHHHDPVRSHPAGAVCRPRRREV